MNREQLIISALATAGSDAVFTPVQTQKIFFLIDRRAAHLFGGTHFDFQPYDYGPFDNAVYAELEKLERDGLVRVEWTGRYKTFVLTPRGFAEGRSVLEAMAPQIQQYLQATVSWVRSLRFDQLVAAIYREFPDMKVNSIFRQ